MAKQLYILFEHACGYGMFRVKEFEEIGMSVPQVEESIADFSRFQSVVKLMAFSPFTNAGNALENINSITEGLIHPDLKVFLETNVPQGEKGEVTLGVGDLKLGASVSENMGIPTQHTGVVPEIMRGIRIHYYKFIKGLTDKSSLTAQLGLGHSYSRSKVKFNVNRIDNMIIQSINLIDQLDKDINTFAMRIREWYSYHFPELIKIVGDNILFAKAVKFITDRKQLDEEHLEGLEEILQDAGKAQAVLDAARSSMGMEISPIDMINIERFANQVIKLSDFRKKLYSYLCNKVNQVSPNLGQLIGELVAARLISHAGSLTNLAKAPASTIQILGAEKALFRALKTRGNTPKYGLIFHSTFIGKAQTKNKGRISRYLANKCAIASRIDCFAEFPTEIFGSHLRGQVEDRLKFFDSGDLPKKNVEVMREAMGAATVIQDDLEKKQKKKDKKDKKKKLIGMGIAPENDDENEPAEVVETSPKKKKRKSKEPLEEENNEEVVEKSPKKKKKKNAEQETDEPVEEVSPKKRKRKSEVAV